MTDRRNRFTGAWGGLLKFFGLREDESATESERRQTDLLWAIFGPVLIVLFVWSLLGQALGMIAVLVMLPFLVVGVREVLSGRAADRQATERRRKKLRGD